MKKTVIFDNNNIILGFGDGNIDPIETKKVIEPKLKESAEAKKLESNNKRFKVLVAFKYLYLEEKLFLVTMY